MSHATSQVRWWRRVDTTSTADPRERVGPTPSPALDNPVSFWGLMTFTFVLLLAPQALIPALASFRLALVAGGVAIAAELFQRFAHRRPLMALTPELWIVLLLFGWAAVTIPLSYWPGGSISFLFGLYVKSLIIFWLLANVVGTVRRLRLVAWGLSLMAFVVAAFGIANYMSGKFLPGGMANRIVGYEAPLTSNPNDLALLLNLILPFAVAMVLTSRGWGARGVLLSCIALSMIGVVVTFSRAGFVTLATIFVMYVWRLRKRPERGWAIAALVLALISLPLLPSGYSERLNTIANIDADPTGSAKGRWAGMMAATTSVLHSPVTGSGLGMSVLALNDTLGKPVWLEVHNVYLQYAVDLGIPGLALFLLLLVRSIKHARSVGRRAARVRGLHELACLAEGVETSLIAFAVAAIFYPTAYHFYFYYVAGVALAITTVCEAEATRIASAGNRLPGEVRVRPSLFSRSNVAR